MSPAWHSPSTACRHTVSGSFNSLNKGSFHLSLTVLVHYRSPRVFSLGRWTSLLPTGLACPVVLKVSGKSPVLFRLRGSHPLCPAFPDSSTTDRFGNSLGLPARPAGPYNPAATLALDHLVAAVWALPLSLATTQGMISFPRGTKMFQFPRFPPPGLFGSARGTQAFPWVGFPIRASPDLCLRQLPGAFRSSPRPSSALGAKASTVCS